MADEDDEQGGDAPADEPQGDEPQRSRRGAGAVRKLAGGVPPIVPYTAALIGVWLAYTAFRNESPLDVIRATLGGSGKPPSPIDGSTGTGPASPAAGIAGPGSTPASVPADVIPRSDDPRLVKIGQGGHKLRTDAAASFASVERVFGRQITVTDSWRDPGLQQDAYEKDPDRFAPASSSKHPKGLAVDVNLQALGAVPPRDGKAGNSVWNKLYAAFTAAGWCNPRGPYRGDHKEPWHFSFLGCG